MIGGRPAGWATRPRGRLDRRSSAAPLPRRRHRLAVVPSHRRLSSGPEMPSLPFRSCRDDMGLEGAPILLNRPGDIWAWRLRRRTATIGRRKHLYPGDRRLRAKRSPADETSPDLRHRDCCGGGRLWQFGRFEQQLDQHAGGCDEHADDHEEPRSRTRQKKKQVHHKKKAKPKPTTTAASAPTTTSSAAPMTTSSAPAPTTTSSAPTPTAPASPTTTASAPAPTTTHSSPPPTTTHSSPPTTTHSKPPSIPTTTGPTNTGPPGSY